MNHHSTSTGAPGLMLVEVAKTAPTGAQGIHVAGPLVPATITNALPQTDVVVPPGYSIFVFMPTGGGTVAAVATSHRA